MHAHWRNDRVLKWCNQQGIHVSAYGPLSSPVTVASMEKDVPNEMEVCMDDTHCWLHVLLYTYIVWQALPCMNAQCATLQVVVLQTDGEFVRRFAKI